MTRYDPKLKGTYSLVQERLRLLLPYISRNVSHFETKKDLVKAHFGAKASLLMNIKLYRLAFFKSNAGGEWGNLIADTRFSSENDGPILFYRPRDSIRIFGICRPPHSVAFYTFWGLQPRREELVVCIQHEQFWKT